MTDRIIEIADTAAHPNSTSPNTDRLSYSAVVNIAQFSNSTSPNLNFLLFNGGLADTLTLDQLERYQSSLRLYLVVAG